VFELICIIAGVIVLVAHGPVWLGIILLALGGIWYFGDGDFDWF
jgi:hypothetical protein